MSVSVYGQYADGEEFTADPIFWREQKPHIQKLKEYLERPFTRWSNEEDGYIKVAKKVVWVGVVDNSQPGKSIEWGKPIDVKKKV